MKKKWVILFLAVAVFMYSLMAYAGDSIKIIVNGKELNPDVPAQIIDGRTMIPARFVAEALGASVSWDANTNSVIIISATNQPSQQPTENTFTGTGKDYTKKIELKDGLTHVKYKYTGESNFVAWLLDTNGNKVELIANEIGSCDGKIATSIKQGTYLIDITAYGSWSITIEQ